MNIKKEQNNAHKVLILGATYSTGNLGVDALLTGTMTSVFEYDRDTDVRLLDYGKKTISYPFSTQYGNSTTIPQINLRFSWKPIQANNVFLLFGLCLALRLLPKSARRSIATKNAVLRQICEADTVLSIAGGDSFSDIYGFKRLLYICLPIYICLLLDRVLIVVPQTLGPFKASWAKSMCAKIISKAKAVYSRDKDSIEAANEILPQPRTITFSHDMAFALTPKKPASDLLPDWLDRTNTKRPLIGLNVSGLLYRGGYTGKNEFELGGSYAELAQKIVKLFIEKLECDVFLASHVVGDGENDYDAVMQLQKDLPDNAHAHLHATNPALSHREIKYVIGQSDFFLGSRMHATIAALSQSVPAVGLAYSRKFDGVFNSIGAKDLVLDLRSMPNDKILTAIESLFRRRIELQKKLTPSVSKAKENALALYTRAITEIG
ncbi:hypothetical protein VDG1235_215 [Verrucomicrobiia bacterium DG1235]|nr:hypothetical protein VDG1235_215 [Verrucomicrobiae bacterium DG1235]